eukprot:1616032-Prymnesium_polylepis.1
MLDKKRERPSAKMLRSRSLRDANTSYLARVHPCSSGGPVSRSIAFGLYKYVRLLRRSIS